MATPGFVYVLINQSLPECVKIGKTTRDPAARAAELSAATGIPTPFMVAYEAFFTDCDYAESFIHSVLEESGVRINGNREFFSLTAPQAINVLIQVHSMLESSPNSKNECNDHETHDENFQDIDFEYNLKNPWEDILEEAEAYLYGLGDVIEDTEKAIALLKKAAKLGSPDAYIHLAQLYEGEKGLEWLKRGAEQGLPLCWLELASVFLGGKSYFEEVPSNINNAKKCFRSFFQIVEPISFNPEGSVLFSSLKKYIATFDNRPEEGDISVLESFISKFRLMLSEMPKEFGGEEKLEELEKLLIQYHLFIA